MRVRVHFLIDKKVFFAADWLTRKQLWHFANCECKQLKWGSCGYIFYLTYFGRLGALARTHIIHNIEWERESEREQRENTFNVWHLIWLKLQNRAAKKTLRLIFCGLVCLLLSFIWVRAKVESVAMKSFSAFFHILSVCFLFYVLGCAFSFVHIKKYMKYFGQCN